MTTQHLRWQQIDQCLRPVTVRETTRQNIQRLMKEADIVLNKRTPSVLAQWADSEAERIMAEALAKAAGWHAVAANFRQLEGKQ